MVTRHCLQTFATLIERSRGVRAKLFKCSRQFVINGSRRLANWVPGSSDDPQILLDPPYFSMSTSDEGCSRAVGRPREPTAREVEWTMCRTSGVVQASWTTVRASERHMVEASHLCQFKVCFADGDLSSRRCGVYLWLRYGGGSETWARRAESMHVGAGVAGRADPRAAAEDDRRPPSSDGGLSRKWHAGPVRGRRTGP